MITPEAEKLILGMVYAPGDTSGGDPGAVLRHFGTEDGAALGGSLFREAVEGCDADQLELAMIVCSRFGFDWSLIKPQIVALLAERWHHRHEDLVSIVGGFKAPDTVAALYQATQWIPDYLDYDDARSLARKAIWALGGIPGPEATAALRTLLTDEDGDLHEAAQEQLERRGEGQ